MSLPPPPGGPGPYPGPQQPWSAGPPPQKRGNGWKWALGAVALLAVVGVTVAVTLSVAGDDDNGAPTASGNTSEIASANDDGPVEVITEDPSCAAQSPILETLANQTRNGWDQRDSSIPASAWTPEVRAQYEEVGQSMRSAADQLVPIAKLTPHRVMRELYEQVIAYSRAYADSIPTYTKSDNDLVRVSNLAGDAIGNICAAINFGSAAARGPLASPLPAPAKVAPLGDPADPQRFLAEPNSICAEWVRALTQFYNETTAWEATDPEIPGSQWTPEQRAVNDEVAPVMRRLASQLQALGERSGNPSLRDFAVLSAQYRRAYVQALPTYIPADHYLVTVALKLGGLVQAACQAAGE